MVKRGVILKGRESTGAYYHVPLRIAEPERPDVGPKAVSDLTSIIGVVVETFNYDVPVIKEEADFSNTSKLERMRASLARQTTE